jgi:lipopolysaccharide export system protein LptA
MKFRLILLLLLSFSAQAEKADKEKPTELEANRMSADDVRRLSIFEGNVVLVKGTMRVLADRIVVRQDAEGYQYATATGNPVRFRQRQDPRPPEKEGAWMDGEALRIEIDEKASTVKLFENARVDRGGDQVAGNYILVDQTSQFFSVSSGKEGKDGKEGEQRVRVTIQPKPPANAKK